MHKLERKRLQVESLYDLQDLIGMRAIVLFKSDLERVETLIKSTFRVFDQEDTGERLDETQFGYQSKHFAIACHSRGSLCQQCRVLERLRQSYKFER